MRRDATREGRRDKRGSKNLGQICTTKTALPPSLFLTSPQHARYPFNHLLQQYTLLSYINIITLQFKHATIRHTPKRVRMTVNATKMVGLPSGSNTTAPLFTCSLTSSVMINQNGKRIYECEVTYLLICTPHLCIPRIDCTVFSSLGPSSLLP